MVILATVEQSPWCFKNKEILHIHRIVRILKSLKTPHYFLPLATNLVTGTTIVILSPALSPGGCSSPGCCCELTWQSNEISEETVRMKKSKLTALSPLENASNTGRMKSRWAQETKRAHFRFDPAKRKNEIVGKERLIQQLPIYQTFISYF